MYIAPVPTPSPSLSSPAETPTADWLWLTHVGEWINDYGAGIAAVATVIAVIVAIWSLAAAATDNRARSRPVVIAEFRRARRNDRAIDLVVRNVGPSLATALEVTFNPELSTEEAEGTTAHLIARRYALPHLVLGPGQELKNLWWSSRQGPDGTIVNSEPTPTIFTVQISYRGARWRPYKDTFEMNVDSIKYETESISSATPERQLKAGVKQLGKVVSGLQAIKNALLDAQEQEPDYVDVLRSLGVQDPPISHEDADPLDGPRGEDQVAESHPESEPEREILSNPQSADLDHERGANPAESASEVH